MVALQLFSLVLFFLLIALPSLYGFHMYLLVYLAHRGRGRARAAQQATIAAYRETTPDSAWPIVTTQVPLFNELPVARRVIEAAARMDYPRGRHEVQVLDDSNDETRDLVDQVANELCAAGYDVKVVRRPDRSHYKAGALAYGVQRARGEFIAVFDADFVPDRGFLRRMIPLIATQPDACAVQGRWGHLNTDETWITQALALGLDMHFAIEQGARNWNGLCMNFNGTAGIWRRAAIEDPRVGGWSGDTITEDLDLSYRAQCAGWTLVYCADEVCPAELPSDVDALKAQQRRWATGTMQTAMKVLPRIWRSPLSLLQKLEATFHITQYAIAVPMVAVAAFGRFLPLLFSDGSWPVWIQYLCTSFLLAAIAPCVTYIIARHAIGGSTPGPWLILKLIVLGLGLCVNNGVAVLVGLVQKGGEFVRTPKSGTQGRSTSAAAYASLRSRMWLVELMLGFFCLGQWYAFLPIDGYFGGIFLLLYAAGLISLGWGSRPWAPKRVSHPAPTVVVAPEALPA